MLEKEILMFFEAERFFSQNQVHLHLKASLVSFTKCMWLNIFTEITWEYILSNQINQKHIFSGCPTDLSSPWSWQAMSQQLSLLPYPSPFLQPHHCLAPTQPSLCQEWQKHSVGRAHTGNSIRSPLCTTSEEGQITGKSQETPTCFSRTSIMLLLTCYPSLCGICRMPLEKLHRFHQWPHRH